MVIVTEADKPCFKALPAEPDPEVVELPVVLTAVLLSGVPTAAPLDGVPDGIPPVLIPLFEEMEAPPVVEMGSRDVILAVTL